MNTAGPAVAAWALALIGLFNIVGSYGSGVLGARYSKRMLLAGIYLARAGVIWLFITLPPTPTVVLLFAAAMGVLWLSTVPLTSGLVAVMFGTRNLGTLFGIVFFSHQVGAFLGVWLGGVAFERTGSFDAIWWAGIALAVVAAALHWPIVERPHPASPSSRNRRAEACRAQRSSGRRRRWTRRCTCSGSRGTGRPRCATLLDGMGIGRGSFYDTFGDKHALFLAALDRFEEARTSWVDEALDGSGMDGIEEVFRRTVEGMTGSEPRRGCLLANTAVELAPRDPEVAARISRYVRRTEEAFAGALVRAGEAGEIPADRTRGPSPASS
jgi:hypothetical protein